MADFQSIPINGTTEKLEKLLGMDIVEAVDEDSNDNQIPTAKAVRDAVGAGGNFVSYTPQSPSEAQKAQARQNIGAMQNGVAEADLDMAYHEVKNVEAIHLINKNIDGEENGGVRLTCYKDIYNEDGKIVCGQLEFAQKDNDMPVVLRRLYPGINDNDAATVGQLKAAKSEILEQILAELPDGDEVSY